MKKTFLKTIGTAWLAILMLAASTQISVFGQDIVNEEKSGEQTTEDASTRRQNARKLVGTWDAQVTVRNCQTGAAIRTFPTILTFMSGRTMLASESAVSQSLHTPGHGVWSYLGGRNYRFKFKGFNFDASGNFTGWTIISNELNLNHRADEYTSVGDVKVYAPNGNLLFTGCSTNTATRFE